MKVTVYAWRQGQDEKKGQFQQYLLEEVSPDMSFLEMLDMLNDRLEEEGKDPVAFESDCREGICGSCSMVINGRAHGPMRETTACQLHMRSFDDGAEIYIEPWRAEAFPHVKDLVVDRSALDRIIESGGYVSVRTGVTTDANAIPISKTEADQAFDAATCIGCGACVAACPNSSAMLFTAAKVSHLGLLPQGQTERYTRVKEMVNQHDDELFGSCTNYGECQDACPKGISIAFIGQLNRDYIKASVCKVKDPHGDVESQ